MLSYDAIKWIILVWHGRYCITHIPQSCFWPLSQPPFWRGYEERQPLLQESSSTWHGGHAPSCLRLGFSYPATSAVRFRLQAYWKLNVRWIIGCRGSQFSRLPVERCNRGNRPAHAVFWGRRLCHERQMGLRRQPCGYRDIQCRCPAVGCQSNETSEVSQRSCCTRWSSRMEQINSQ